MSWSSRRTIVLFTMLGTLTGVSLVGHAFAQKAQRIQIRQPIGIGGGPAMPPDAPGATAKKKPAYDLGILVLPKDDDLADSIASIEDKIKRKNWADACDKLQRLIGRPEDIWIPITRKMADGTSMTAYVSVKKQALHMIATLPPEGRKFYEENYGGPKAEPLFKAARTNSDAAAMGQVMGLYLYTEAGAEAAVWLGTYMLDRAEFQGATSIFMRLIQRGPVKDIKDRTLIKAAYAFHHAGETVGKEMVFKELARRGVEIKLRDRALSVADIRDEIDKMPAGVSLMSASDSPIYRGRPNRTAMLPGGTPFLEPAWKQKMWRYEPTNEQINKAELALANKGMPVLTAFSPITATTTQGDKQTPLLIYRSHWGIQAVSMKTGKLAWDAQSELSLDSVLGAVAPERDAHKVGAYTNWLGHYLQTSVRPQMLFENSVLNTLSTDNKFVYAVEDLPIPPPQQFTMGGFNPGMPNGGTQNWGPEVTAAINHNRLFAYDLAKEGKAAWDIGGGDKGPLADTYFLGPPLPLNGKLYVLTEKLQELRLATIEAATGKILGLQALASTKDTKLSQDPIRRVQACHLSYAEGILIVPTNAGAIFGVDLFSNSLLWASPYRDKTTAAAQPPVNIPWGAANPPGWVRMPDGTWRQINSDTYWQVTAPAIADGKVVFTAPDDKNIHCLNLRDGSPLWSAPRDNEDLYMAGVFNGKVIIVGKNRTRALSLAKGQELWRLETGKPSGQGAASMPAGNGDVIYYLPIRESVATREPEICAINIDKGIIHAHTRSRKREVPGNLIFYEGSVLSQTHREVVAYPQLEYKLAEMDRLVKANPDDPVALTERGDYLLDKGDLTNAIADFRRALRNDKINAETRTKARAKLHEALTDLFQRDFAKAEDFIKEYEELCNINLEGKVGADRTAALNEMRRRRANFLCLVGKGRERQNRLVEAFEKYLELGMEAKKDELIQVVDEPTVKTAPDVWSQGRIASMVANATDARQKQALEDEIRKRWDKIKETKAAPLDELRKFVSLFGSLFDVGKEARLALAERLMDDTDVNSLLEAEQQLSLLRGDSEKPEIAARALEAMARLNQGKKRVEDAAYYYRLLAEKFPKVKVNGKTGAEYLDDLATDKRYWPYIDQTGRFKIKGKVELKFKEDKGFHAPASQVYQFAHSGESLPYFNRHKIGLSLDYNQQLKITDLTTNDVKTLPLTRTDFQRIATANPAPNRVKFSYQNMGHLVVIQLGHMVFGIDPLNTPRVLWERNLSSLPNSATSAPSHRDMKHDPRDNSLHLVYTDESVQHLGQAGPLQGSVVTLALKDSLQAIDPITGRTLWTRTDVNSRSQVFGDQEYVFVVGTSDDGKPSGTRVFRAYDGVTVKAKDFTSLFAKRIGVQGRTLLVEESEPAKGAVGAPTITLRMYDILKGEDVWKEVLPAGSMVMTSEDPKLGGFVDPRGNVRVFDIEKHKEVMTAKLYDPKHFDNPQSIYLVSDQDYFYVAVNGQLDPNIPNWPGMPQGIQSNVSVGSGLRTMPVHGYLYSFKRKTGAIQWFYKIENEQMIVSMMDELPMLIFSAWYYHRSPPPANFQTIKRTAQVRAKHNGKLWWNEENLPQNMFFHALTMDHRSGKVELTGSNLKVTLDSVPFVKKKAD